MTTSLDSSSTPRETLSNAVADVKTTVGDVAHSITDAFNRSKTTAAEQLDSGRAAVTDYTRANPLRTIGVAALAGIALGVLFFRR